MIPMIRTWTVRALSVAALLLFSTGPTFAQCDPGGGTGGTGVDLIVSDIPTTASTDAVNGIYGFSYAVQICNIGTDPAPYETTGADHPLLFQSFYRLHDGRLDMVGASWLRPLLLPAAQDGCGCGCVPAGFSSLGAGCSDVTSAAVNGSPSQLIAPSELIDASQGLTVFPSMFNPPVADATSRKVRVPAIEIDPFLNLGADYYTEVMVISPSDALDGNPQNSASVRQVVVSLGSGFVLQPAGPTGVQQTMLDRWAALDATVTVTEISDGAGGTFQLASRVADLGGGQWRYDYALLNRNSARGAESFTVTTGAAALSQLHFNDVDSHSGDVFDSTDWTSSSVSGLQTWSTDSAAVNPLANALRAGRMTSFGFVADLPPVSGTATVEFFEGSGANSTGVTVLAPATGFLDCNANGIADSVDISSGTSGDCDGNGVPDECDVAEFVRGDVNLDLTVNLADPITLLTALFAGGSLDCPAAADANLDQQIDVADPVWVLSFLFSGGPAPGAPFPACGPDPAGAGPLLGCCASGCP